eukprot:5680482-Amphidinium_carterae.1
MAKMENCKKRKEISARTRHQHKSLEQCLKEAPWRRPDESYQVVMVSDATDDLLPWWTGSEHEDFRTKTFDISQHKFMEDLDSETEVFVNALTEEGFEFSFQYTKKTDP